MENCSCIFFINIIKYIHIQIYFYYNAFIINRRLWIRNQHLFLTISRKEFILKKYPCALWSANLKIFIQYCKAMSRQSQFFLNKQTSLINNSPRRHSIANKINNEYSIFFRPNCFKSECFFKLLNWVLIKFEYLFLAGYKAI